MSALRSSIAGVAACLALIGSAGCRTELPEKLEPGQSVTVQGEIQPGAECPMLVVGERRFSLAGDLGKFRAGDRVCVRGRVAEMSFCMAGEAVIAITAIGAENDCR